MLISYFEVATIFFVAILFVITFSIQRNFFPKNYFANSQIVLDNLVTYRMLSIRYISIFFFGLVSYFIVNKITVVVIGAFLGSFLIIWPAILSPSEAYMGYVKPKDKVFIYLIHFLFVITSIIVVYFSAILFPLLRDYILENKISALFDLLLWFFFASIGFPAEKKLGDYLDKRIMNNDLVGKDEQRENL